MKRFLSLILVLCMVLTTIALVPMTASAEDISADQWRQLPYGQSFNAFLSTAAETHNNGYGAAKDEIKNINFVNNSVIYNGAKLFNHLTSTYGVVFNATTVATPKQFALSGTDVKYYKQIGTIWRKGANSTADATNHKGEITVTYLDGETSSIIGHGYVAYTADVLGTGKEAYSAEGAHFITTSDASGHDGAYYPLTNVAAASHNSILHALIGVEYSIDELVETVLPAIIDQLTSKKEAGTVTTAEREALYNTVASANTRGEGYDVVSELSADLQAKYSALAPLYPYAEAVSFTKEARITAKNGVGTIFTGTNPTRFGNASLDSILTALENEAQTETMGTKEVTSVKKLLDGNAIKFNLQGLFPTLEDASSGAHFDSTIIWNTNKTIDLSGKYLKGVAIIGNNHYGDNEQGYQATLISNDTTDTDIVSDKLISRYYTSGIYSNTITPVFVSGFKTNETSTVTTTVYNVGVNTVYNSATPIPVNQIKLAPDVYGSALAVYAVCEIEYDFDELTTVMTNVIGAQDKATITDETKASIKATIESAEERGYDALNMLGTEVYEKYLSFYPKEMEITSVTAKDLTAGDVLDKNAVTITGTLPENATFTFKEDGVVVTTLSAGTHQVELTISAEGYISFVQTISFTVAEAVEDVESNILLLPYGEAFGTFMTMDTATHSNNYPMHSTETKNQIKAIGRFINNGVIYNGANLFSNLDYAYGVSFAGQQTKTLELIETDIKYYKAVGTIWKKGNINDAQNHKGEVKVTYSDATVVSTLHHGYTINSNAAIGRGVDILGRDPSDNTKTIIDTVLDGETDYITTSDAWGHDGKYYPLTKVEFASHNSILHSAIGIEYSIKELEETVLPAIINDLTDKKNNGESVKTETLALQRTVDSANARVEDYDILSKLSQQLQEKYNALSVESIYASLVAIPKDGRILVKDGTVTEPIYAGNKTAIGIASLNTLLNNVTTKAVSQKMGTKTFTAIQKSDNDNTISFDIKGLFPALTDAQNGTHFDSAMIFNTSKTFDLSGKFLKGVAVVGVNHYADNDTQGYYGTFISKDGTKFPADDAEKQWIKTYNYKNEGNPIITSKLTTADGVSSQTLYNIHLTTQYTDAQNPNPVNQYEMDVTGSAIQIFGIYEIEYGFEELTEVMKKVIGEADADTISRNLRKSIRLTIESAQSRGYDALNMLGEETYAKYLEICPDLKGLAYATTVNFTKDARVLLKDGVATTPAGTNYSRFGIASLNSLINSVNAIQKEQFIGEDAVRIIERDENGAKTWYNTNGLFPTLSEATGENFDSTVIWTGKRTFELSGKFLKGVSVLGVNHYNVINTQHFASKLSSASGATTGFKKMTSHHSTHTTNAFVSGVTTTEAGEPTETAYNIGLTTHYLDAQNPIPVSFMELDMTGTAMDEITTNSALDIFAIYEIEYSVNELKDTVIPNILNNTENMTDAEIAVVADALGKTVESAKDRGFELSMLESDVLAKYLEICPEIPESDTLTVKDVIPANNSTNVSKDTDTIIIEFSNILDKDYVSDKITITANNVKLGADIIVARNKIIAVLDAPLGSNKTVVVSANTGIKDIYGNETAAMQSITFETQYEEMPMATLFEDDFETSADLNNWVSSNANTPLEIVNDPFSDSNRVLKFKANVKDGGTASFTRPFTDAEGFAGSIAVTFKYAWNNDGTNTDWGYMPRFMTLKDTNDYYNGYMGAGGHGVVRIYGTTKEAGGEGATIDTSLRPFLKWQKMTYIINLSANTISFSIDGGAYETRYFASAPTYNNIYKELMIDLGQSSSETESAEFYLDDVKVERIPDITVLSNYGETLNPAEDIVFTLNVPMSSAKATVKNENGETIAQSGVLSSDGKIFTIPAKGILDYNETYTIDYNFVSAYGTSKSSQVVISTPKAKSVNFVDAITVTPNASKTEFTASFTITNPESLAKNVWVVLAAYNSNNKMLKIISAEYLAPVGTYTPETPLVLSEVPSGTTVVRAFMWDSPETLNAFQMPIEFNIQ